MNIRFKLHSIAMGLRGSSGMNVTFRVVFYLIITLGVGFAISVAYTKYRISSEKDKDIFDRLATAFADAIGGIRSFKTTNFLSREIPPEVSDFLKFDSDKIQIDKRMADIDGTKIAYRTSGEAANGMTFILLHGQAFTSATWEKPVPTMKTLTALGFKVFAVDLPGFGDSPQKNLDDPGEFLAKLIENLSPDRSPIVVSPSMSGIYSIETLIRFPDSMCGYVPVAPVHTVDIADSDFEAVRTPTLIIYGERDTTLGKTSAKKLVNIPSSSEPQIIPNARHPCYLDDIPRWHQLLYNFAMEISENCAKPK